MVVDDYCIYIELYMTSYINSSKLYHHIWWHHLKRTILTNFLLLLLLSSYYLSHTSYFTLFISYIHTHMIWRFWNLVEILRERERERWNEIVRSVMIWWWCPFRLRKYQNWIIIMYMQRKDTEQEDGQVSFIVKLNKKKRRVLHKSRARTHSEWGWSVEERSQDTSR
mgnify:CR=1 FL=1